MEYLKTKRSRRLVIVPKKKNKKFEVKASDTHPSLPKAPKKKPGRKPKKKLYFETL